MNTPLTEHWRRGWKAVGATPPQGLLERVVAAWEEPQRHYHTLNHLEHCLAEFEPVAAQAERQGEVLVALFFHDAVYDPRNVVPHANERASADWAAEALGAAGVDGDVVAGVDALIMATCHDAAPDDGDPALLVDVDLAILGQSPARFDAYEDEVRREYGWVPPDAFRTGRTKVLRQFLDRPVIYRTEHFNARYEAAARENLARSLAALEAG